MCHDCRSLLLLSLDHLCFAFYLFSMQLPVWWKATFQFCHQMWNWLQYQGKGKRSRKQKHNPYQMISFLCSSLWRNLICRYVASQRFITDEEPVLIDMHWVIEVVICVCYQVHLPLTLLCTARAAICPSVSKGFTSIDTGTITFSTFNSLLLNIVDFGIPNNLLPAKLQMDLFWCKGRMVLSASQISSWSHFSFAPEFTFLLQRQWYEGTHVGFL